MVSVCLPFDAFLQHLHLIWVSLTLGRAEAGRTPCPNSSSQEELPCVRGQGRWLRGATRCPRPGTAAARSHPASEVGVAAGRSNPTPEASGGGWEEQPHIQGAVAAQAQEGLEEPSHVEGQEGRQEEIPLTQGKEQWLCFAGAAVKRYSMSKVRETPARW